MDKELSRIRSPFVWDTDEFMDWLDKAPLELLELELSLARCAEKLSYTRAQNARFEILISMDFTAPTPVRPEYEYLEEAKRVEKQIAKESGYGSRAYRTAIAQRSGRILRMKMKDRFKG